MFVTLLGQMRECDERYKALQRLRYATRKQWSASVIVARQLDVDLSYLRSTIAAIRGKLITQEEAPKKQGARRERALRRYYRSERCKPRKYDRRDSLERAMRRIVAGTSGYGTKGRLSALEAAARRILFPRRVRSYSEKRIAKALRRRLEKIVKGYRRRTEDLIGCSVSQLRAHLEAKFTGGMSWDNYGLWHIDHARPCRSFDLRLPEQQRACFHFSNLQPLWAGDNLSKNCKIL